MRATQLSIQNYRSIDSLSIDLESFSVLVGPNNAGKSNVMAAIRSFYEKDKDDKFDRERDFPKFADDQAESWIEIEFQLDPSEIATIKKEYLLKGDSFRVRKWLRTASPDETKAEGSYYGYENAVLSSSRFYGWKNVTQAKLGSVIFIPAASSIAEHTKLTGPSALRELLSVVLRDVLKSSESYSTLTGAFRNFAADLKSEQTKDGSSLDLLERTISESLADWDASLEIKIGAIPPDDILKTLLTPAIVDNALQAGQPASAYGQGFQRHLIFSLLRLSSVTPRRARQGSTDDFSPNLLWLLYEEPEAYLHPTRTRSLSRYLRSFGGTNSQQVLVCTHSPQFASSSLLELPLLTRLNKDGVRTYAGQVRRDDLQSYLADNPADLLAAGAPTATEDLSIEMESIKHALWLNPARSGVFFADHVLLVEGPTEQALISRLIDDGRLPDLPVGIEAIDTLGKYNTHRFMRLLSHLRIKHSVIYDSDKPSPINAGIAKLIQSSKTEYTVGISTIAGTIESFLGIPACKETHRKPQYMLW